MEKSGIQHFACYTEPATLGSRWKRWLTSFQLYADGKGLIVAADSPNATRQRRRALLLHLAGPDVQDIFSALLDTGEATQYDEAVKALNAYVVPQVNTALAWHAFQKMHQKPGEMVQQFATRLRDTV
jgi:hypothetical protein